MKPLWLSLLAITLSLAPVGAFAQDSLFAPDEEDFLDGATEANLREAALGNIGAQRATRASIRSLAQDLEDDHVAAQAQLNRIAAAGSFALPDEVSDGDEDTVEYFATVKSSRFDRDFIRQVIHDHEKDISDYQDALEDEDIGPDLAAYIARTLPVMQAHLNQALLIRRTQTEPARRGTTAAARR